MKAQLLLRGNLYIFAQGLGCCTCGTGSSGVASTSGNVGVRLISLTSTCGSFVSVTTRAGVLTEGVEVVEVSLDESCCSSSAAVASCFVSLPVSSVHSHLLRFLVLGRALLRLVACPRCSSSTITASPLLVENRGLDSSDGAVTAAPLSDPLTELSSSEELRSTCLATYVLVTTSSSPPNLTRLGSGKKTLRPTVVLRGLALREALLTSDEIEEFFRMERTPIGRLRS